MARSRVARTRLTPEEYDAHVSQPAVESGITPAEYLRKLIVGAADEADTRARIASLESRVMHLETQLAEQWAKGGQSVH